MYKRNASAIYIVVAAVIAAMALAACSTKKNTAATRKYQEFITRYNIHYNGDTHYRETLADMESKYEDDYSRLVFMHPVEAKADPSAPQPSGDFNRSIEKAQKAIQLRSIKKKPAKKSGKRNDPKYKEWMKRDEYNPFLHNSWMMMGRGQYYNGDFLGAASTFFYVSKHFTWLPATVTEAKLMQALSYISLGWLFEAEMILTRIKLDDLPNNKLRRLYNFAYA
ncbi:MAG: tetratricopeptide repeat protein, partial [Muribaculaceae bacterium]|nr:tetratricopeptide repeat protein [Muribaculaceae bacterium]